MATKNSNPAAKRRITQLTAIEQADAILKTAEDKQIERINRDSRLLKIGRSDRLQKTSQPLWTNKKQTAL